MRSRTLRRKHLATALVAALAGALTSDASAQNDARAKEVIEQFSKALVEPTDAGPHPMRNMLEDYAADRAILGRFYDTPMSSRRLDREHRFYQTWLLTLRTVDFELLAHDDRIDYILFFNHLRYEMRSLAHEIAKREEMLPLIPFADEIVALQETRRDLEPIDAPAVAARMDALSEQVLAARKTIEAALAAAADEEGEGGNAALPFDRSVANRAARALDRLRDTLRGWFRFYDGYDPSFSWWVRKPYEAADEALEAHGKFLRHTLVGIDPDDPDDPDGPDTTDAIIGDPVGRDELLSMLEYEMIPYTPEELIAIARREYEWCRAEFLRAANDLGFGDDWRAALEHVKGLHVEPGQQPQLIRDLALEAIEFLETRELVTIPVLCKETWRMEMMSPERQRMSPYFLGGEVIMVAFPTDDMAHADKLMSLRGNNIHFARATVHHELIPGHHLQGFMNQRHRTHRRIFRTPFWGEGWALYWEMLLWDLDFPRSPEDRIGMLFWRTHRCARIIFSLEFHLGAMTAEEATDFLVENVGHERNNATAEVRRSVSGDYGPLYQAAYMLGGLQIRALREELVDSGRMTDRAFHDAILRQNSIPIEMVRAALIEQPLTPDFRSQWRFYGDVDAGEE